LTVRELIGHWGLHERDRAANQQIEAGLANHGLTTAPDFRAVSMDSTVKLIGLPGPDEDYAPLALGLTGSTIKAEVVEEDSLDIGLTLGNLLPDDHSLVSVPPAATFEQAITIMLLNDFSQLAILAGPRTLRGAVTWKSIARARHVNSEATFSSAIAPARDFSYDTRLLDVLDLDILQKEEFIFVRAYDGRISGIITATDVVRTYDKTATPFFLLGEVDQELRRLIQNTFELNIVRQACAGSTVKSFDTMTIGQYQAVLANPEYWAELGWPLDRKLFIERLDEIRKIRNTVMHFNPDPIPDTAIDKLRNFLRLVRTYIRDGRLK